MMASLSHHHGPQAFASASSVPAASASVPGSSAGVIGAAGSASVASPDLSSGRAGRRRHHPGRGGSKGAPDPAPSPSPLLAPAAPGLSLSLEKLLETASLTGDLRLSGRNLKAVPPSWGAGASSASSSASSSERRKYDLRDTVLAGRNHESSY